ncbi:hypothetical protein [Ralstonia phage RP13]|nr:hypothetical protein [Ralstonia phage RP13]
MSYSTKTFIYNALTAGIIGLVAVITVSCGDRGMTFNTSRFEINEKGCFAVGQTEMRINIQQEKTADGLWKCTVSQVGK